ncbi:MAG: molybdopterin-synthase adenylyltransferase MoeB [Rhodospirillaceae bacterium]|nr:molybdopterin-synthase adenylyltransferase MoeB [Rhodospirillaceae bacterium]
MDFDDSQIHRYARHIILPEIGGTGQARLLQSRVLVVGAGGLGSAVLLYLAAAGVGTIGIVDDDVVDLSNLQRQVIHDVGAIGTLKVDSAARRIAALNPDVTVEAHGLRLTAANARDLVGRYDVVADGSDNFETRYIVNDACFLAGRPLVSAAILRFEGQLATFRAHGRSGLPCYRCLYPERPPDGMVPSCAQAGILGALAGVMGTLQAVEVVKQILALGNGMAGRLLLYDALGHGFRTLSVARDPDCSLCGDAATTGSGGGDA